jgi:hypothetical protein
MKTIFATTLLLLLTAFTVSAKANELAHNPGGPSFFLMHASQGAKLENVGSAPTVVRTGGAFDLEVTAGTFGSSELEVTDASGRVIRSVNITLDQGVNRLHIKVKDLAKGLHFVRIVSGDQVLVRAFEVR